MQVSLISGIAAALLLSMSAARAATCDPPPRTEVDVAPTPSQPAMSKLVSAQLTRELDDPPPRTCAKNVVIRIEVRWPDADHADLHVEIRHGNTGRTAVRTVDLSTVPSDGRPLAVSIAATELVDEASAAEHVVAAEAPVAPVSAPPRPARSEREHLGAFGPQLAIDAFTAGPTLIGPDARLALTITPRIEAALRFGVRAPISTSTFSASYVFGASVGIASRPLSDPFGVTGRLHVDAVSLSATTDAHATLLVPAVGAGLWIRTSRYVRVHVDGGVGAPIRAEGAAARGVMLSLSTALVVSF